MGLGRVMSMVPGVRDGLRISQPADEQQADGHADGDGSENASRQHRGDTNGMHVP